MQDSDWSFLSVGYGKMQVSYLDFSFVSDLAAGLRVERSLFQDQFEALFIDAPELHDTRLRLEVRVSDKRAAWAFVDRNPVTHACRVSVKVFATRCILVLDPECLVLGLVDA